MLLVTTPLRLIHANAVVGRWTQTLRLDARDAGETGWRREERGGWSAERWFLAAGGLPIREIAEGTLPRRRGETKLGSFRVVVLYGKTGAGVLLERTDRSPRKAHFAAPVGIPRGLPTPGTYRRHAHSGGHFRFAKFDAFRLKWDVIDATYLGTRAGHPTFRERNPNVPATWDYSFDRAFRILAIDLHDGYRLDRLPERLVRSARPGTSGARRA